MLSFIRKYKLKKAFNSYVFKLGPSLKSRYGNQEQYTVLQIEKTAKDLHLDLKRLPYAIALYRYEESKNTVNLYKLDQQFLNILRQEIGDSIFNGKSNYTVKNVFGLSMKFGSNFVTQDNINAAGGGY